MSILIRSINFWKENCEKCEKRHFCASQHIQYVLKQLKICSCVKFTNHVQEVERENYAVIWQENISAIPFAVKNE